MHDLWGYSSVGRALQWHCKGHRFEPDYLHQFQIKALFIKAFFMLKIRVFRWDTGLGHKGGTQRYQNSPKKSSYFQVDLRELDKF